MACFVLIAMVTGVEMDLSERRRRRTRRFWEVGDDTRVKQTTIMRDFVQFASVHVRAEIAPPAPPLPTTSNVTRDSISLAQK